MSAYVCNPEHIAALAAFACTFGSRNCAIYETRTPAEDAYDQARNVAALLMAANVDSVGYRYSTKDDEAKAVLIAKSQDLAEKYMSRPTGLTPMDIIRMAQCLDYQSCEVNGWRDTLAYRQINWIIDQAISQLPGYENAIRDYDGQRKAAS